MSALDAVAPVGIATWPEEDLEEYLADTFDDIREIDHERRHGGHDRDGYFAHLAGSTACVKLGHAPESSLEFDDDGEPVSKEAKAWAEGHPLSWDGDRFCSETRYGVACTACEGECDSITTPTVDLWALVRRDR